MVDVFDILEVLLAMTAILGGVFILFSPMIAFVWWQRHEQPHASSRRGFAVLDAHPPVAPTAAPMPEPLHVLPLDDGGVREEAA